MLWSSFINRKIKMERGIHCLPKVTQLESKVSHVGPDHTLSWCPSIGLKDSSNMHTLCTCAHVSVGSKNLARSQGLGAGCRKAICIEVRNLNGFRPVLYLALPFTSLGSSLTFSFFLCKMKVPTTPTFPVSGQ